MYGHKANIAVISTQISKQRLLINLEEFKLLNFKIFPDTHLEH